LVQFFFLLDMFLCEKNLRVYSTERYFVPELFYDIISIRTLGKLDHVDASTFDGCEKK
jgi:hypothetical protein